MMNGIRDRLLQESLRNYNLNEKTKTRDDRAQLSSMKQSIAAVPELQPPSTRSVGVDKPTLSVEPPSAEPSMPHNPWAIDSPAAFSLGSPVLSTSEPPQRDHARDISPSTKSDGSQPRLIPQEHVNLRLNANEEFLERRRQSRILFQKEFRQSISSINESRASQVFSDSPTLGLHSAATLISTSVEKRRASDLRSNGSISAFPILEDSRTPISPIEGRTSRTSGNGYDTLITRKRSQGGASQASRESRTSSILQSPPQGPQRTNSQASQDSIFGLRAAPLSPPLTDRGSGSDNNWGTLATTLQLPGFGKGVESGLEVMSPVDHDNGLILANENHIYRPTPTSSMKSVDHPMRHDTSFYKFGGFCEGSRAILRGEVGLRVIKRPLVYKLSPSSRRYANITQGQFKMTISGRCNKCSYEVSWNDVEKDTKLDRRCRTPKMEHKLTII